MKIAIGTDHAAYDLKEILKENLQKWGHTVQDFGTNSTEAVDYPDFALPVAETVKAGKADRGILLCGNGLGMSYAANKVPGIRAALVWDEELAKESREHGDANIIVVGGRPASGGIEPDKAISILKIFLDTPFQGGRHKRRVDKINEIEKKYLK